MLPSMSDVLTEWEQAIKLKTVSITSIDFVDTTVITVENKRAVVQVAEKENLRLDSLDWSKEYKMVHAKYQLEIGQFVESSGKDFKIIGLENYGEYGYYMAIAEETKKALLVAI